MVLVVVAEDCGLGGLWNMKKTKKGFSGEGVELGAPSKAFFIVG